MKLTIFLVLSTLLCSACGEVPADSAAVRPVQKVAAAQGVPYRWLPDQSTIRWKATHTGGLSPRFGSLRLLNGGASVQEGQLSSGVLEIDMASLVVAEESVTETDKKASDLQELLKGETFFNVAQYPRASFVLTGVVPFDTTVDKSLLSGVNYKVSGNLNIKAATRNITFPAVILVQDSLLLVKANFMIDRDSWGLNFGSAGNPADMGVSKEFEVTISLTGLKEHDGY